MDFIVNDGGMSPERKIITRATLLHQRANAPEVIKASEESRNKARLLAIVKDAVAKSHLIAEKNLRSWMDVHNELQLPIVPPFNTEPFSIARFHDFVNFMELHGVPILEGMSMASLTEKDVRREYHKLQRDLKLANNVVLKPQQQKGLEALIELWEAWKANPARAYSGCMIPLRTGRGKSYIVATFLKYLLDTGELGMLFSAFILCPASVIHKTIRTCARIGISQDVLDSGIIKVESHQYISSKQMSGMYRQVVEDYYGNEVKRWQYLHVPPKVVNLDESQYFKKMKSKRTERAMAWVTARKSFFILTSATPGVTLVDLEFFSLASSIKYLGEPLQRKFFTSLALAIRGPSRVALNEPNAEAMGRFRDKYSSIFITPKDDPQKVKMYTHTDVVDFTDDKMMAFYFDAEGRWWEAKERAGEDPSQNGIKQAHFTIMRMAEEQCKVPRLVDRSIQYRKDGFAPITCYAFTESLVDHVIGMVDRGIPREEIAVIWGGHEIVKPEDLMSEKEAGHWLFRKYKLGEKLPKPIAAKLKKTMNHIKDRLKRELTAEQKAARDARMIELRLNHQSIDERDIENERFLDGIAKYCVFTLPAGGMGIDLDHQRPNNFPRKMDCTVIYYAEEFLQGIGRPYRIATLSDVHVYIVYMRGTVTFNHVAPKLDPKLKSVHKLATGNDDYTTVLDAIEDYTPNYAPPDMPKLRSAEDILMEEYEDEPFGEEADDEDDEDDNNK